MKKQNLAVININEWILNYVYSIWNNKFIRIVKNIIIPIFIEKDFSSLSEHYTVIYSAF